MARLDTLSSASSQRRTLNRRQRRRRRNVLWEEHQDGDVSWPERGCPWVCIPQTPHLCWFRRVGVEAYQLVRYRPTTHEQATQTDDNGVVPPLYSRLPPPTSCPLSRRDVLADIHQRRDNIASAIINDEYVPQARDQPRHHISEMPDLTVDYTWLLYTNDESSDWSCSSVFLFYRIVIMSKEQQKQLQSTAFWTVWRIVVYIFTLLGFAPWTFNWLFVLSFEGKRFFGGGEYYRVRMINGVTWLKNNEDSVFYLSSVSVKLSLCNQPYSVRAIGHIF